MVCATREHSCSAWLWRKLREKGKREECYLCCLSSPGHISFHSEWFLLKAVQNVVLLQRMVRLMQDSAAEL